MKFSILAAIYNEENNIGKLIESILKQNKDFELILMDGGSIDRTEEIVKSFNDKRIKFINSGNGNLHKRVEEARMMATGDIITALSADDYYFNGVLDKVEKNIKDYLCGIGLENGERVISIRRGRGATPATFWTKEFLNKNKLRYEWENYPNIADTVILVKAWSICKPIILNEPLTFVGSRNTSPIWSNGVARFFEYRKMRKELNNI